MVQDGTTTFSLRLDTGQILAGYLVFCFSRLFLDVFLDVLDVMDQRQGSLNMLLFVLGELSIMDLFSVMLSSSNLHFILTATVCGAFRTLTHNGINQKASSY